MTEKNLWDTATDILKQRVQDGFDILRKDYKSTNPYRKEPVSAKEQLYEYSQFIPEKDAMMRQALGDAMVDDYHMRMQALLRRQR